MNERISRLIETIDVLPGIWCLMDPQSRYLHYNLAYLKMIGAEHLARFELIGKTVADMPCAAATCADLFWEADAEVRRTKKMVTVLNTIKMENDQWWVVQINKTPILNEQNEIEAMLFNFIDHSHNYCLDLAMLVGRSTKNSQNKALIRIKTSQDLVALGTKESEILFFLIKGLSYKKIASLQDIAYSTVVDHVERLKNKFNASTTDELISNAIASGYPKSIPQNLFTHQFSILYTS